MALPNIDDNELPSDLYHYTSGTGLLGILDSERLWATHAGYLNDAQEIIYGQRQVDDLLRRLTTKQWSLPDELKDDALWPSASKGVVRSALAKVLFVVLAAAVGSTMDFLRQNSGPFVACLSSERDQLSQWRGYSSDGGYAIRFDTAALRESLQVNRTGMQLGFEDDLFGSLELGYRHLVKMRYSTDDAFIRSQIMEFFRSLLLHLTSHAGDDPQFDRERFNRTGEEILRQRMSWILAIIMQMKNPGFLEEKEYRIITFAPPDRFHASGIGLVPRVDIPIDPSCIKEIVVGPGVNLDLRRSSVEYYRKTRAQYSHVEISVSETPFRGT